MNTEARRATLAERLRGYAATLAAGVPPDDDLVEVLLEAAKAVEGRA